MKTLVLPFSGSDPALRDMAHEYRRAAGARLRAIREGAGMSQLDVARRLDVVPTAVSAWETGRIPLPPERYASICEIFGLPPREFARFMLRWTNPWAYVMLFPDASDVSEVRDELATLSDRYRDRLPPSKKTRADVQ